MIGVLLVSAFVVILNETLLGVAIPHLMIDLQITAGTAQWLTTAYMLTMAVVIPVTGFLIQRFSTRPVFLSAMILFTAGTLVCALAPGFDILLVGRIVQAAGTAMMMPLLMTTVMTLVSPERRGRASGNIVIVISVAPAIGPTVSGLVLSTLDWRWLFWIVLPIAAIALVLGAVLLRNVTPKTVVPLDLLSVVLSAFAFGGIVFGLSGIAEPLHGLPPFIPLTVGAASLAVFVLRQRLLARSDKALLDLRTFRSRNFALSVVILAATMIALFGTGILIPIYLQGVLGVDVLTTGLLLLPGGVLMGVLAPLVGRLYDRSGPTALVVGGTAAVSAALWFLSFVSEQTTLGAVLAAYVLLSIGLAFALTPLFTSALGSLPPSLYADGSAVVGTTQQLAGAAGTALFITVMTVAAGDGGTAANSAGSIDGIRAAFLCGALIATIATAVACFIRKPASIDKVVIAH